MTKKPSLVKLLHKIYPRKNPWIVVAFIEILWPTLFTLAKMTKIPVLGKMLGELLYSKDDKLIYLPKRAAVTRREVVEVMQPLKPPENIVLPSIVVEYFIKKAKHHFIMDFCICRKSNQCEEYPINLGCLFLGEASRNLPSEFGRSVTENEALEHVEECKEAGLVHLIGRHRVDSIWLNAPPEEKLLTICNCCPCCCLHRTIPFLHPSLGAKVKRMPGLTVEVTDECIGCGTCADICFVNAIDVRNGKADIGDVCKGCGRCVEVCPEGAINLTIERSDFLEKTISEIEHVVDVS
ncbi:MAG: 4Fe-4S ferredoxin [Candidatus Korarchaeota archaeon]|nr:4Fe-4S ferredoxin [Candidatus Korarchaeota archaeon]NIU82255.1 4Fe-4S ferredoxin [Candidatus Thorarchaeota archaeon]NIW12706.1 4Fe-4S ferredoxin [Candidatus Thorarchaeota archaeon]NIW50919.1 4Fe-4S ferredoxin [Candidatus Korarchaeota archaeon]